MFADWQGDPNVEYKKGHYGLALRGFSLRAWEGDEVAQDNLGMMYANGKGTPRDFQQAAVWYRKSAQQGYAPAQRRLAGLYENGNGVAFDISVALEWYRKAVAQNFVPAQRDMGILLSAAKAGAFQDLDTAKILLTQAKEHGDPIAEERLEAMQMQANEQAHAQRLQQDPLAGLRARAAANDAESAYQMAVAYARGQLINENWQEAERWYQKAANHGHAAAQFELGLEYSSGKHRATDYVEAAYWYRKAASQSLMKAANNLGVLYDQGYGVALDRNQAAVWFSKGAEGGDADARFNLGSMYWLGHGVRKDIGRAGNDWAHYNLH